MSIKNQYSKEVKQLLKTNNLFLLAEINFKDKKYSYDSLWCGFETKCELRKARYRKITHPKELEKLGYNFIVYDIKSLVSWIKKGAGKVILHKNIVQKYFPSFEDPQRYISTVKDGGFINLLSQKGSRLHRKKLSRKEKESLFSKMKKACYLCSSPTHIELHHILPRSYGGGTEYENIIPLCKDCHKEIHKDNNKLLELQGLRVQRLMNNLKKKKLN
ncbi:MAG: HNH endonuclease [Candidatus Woesearchaeota archaeon]